MTTITLVILTLILIIIIIITLIIIIITLIITIYKVMPQLQTVYMQQSCDAESNCTLLQRILLNVYFIKMI